MHQKIHAITLSVGYSNLYGTPKIFMAFSRITGFGISCDMLSNGRTFEIKMSHALQMLPVHY